MQYKQSIISASLIASTLAAYVPSEPWSTLTPDTPAPSGAHTEYTKTFGIAVIPITTGSLAPTSTAAAAAKRDVISQINDGQIQADTTTLKPTSTSKPKAEVISQIGDGQIQATVTTAPTCEEKTVTVTVTACPKQTAEVISQIGDGQIQATATTTKPTADAISQISDGQIQATTATTSSPEPTGPTTFENLPESCLTDKSLAITLKDSILTDSAGRIGAIVSNRQFQFDGPPPQAGSIYAAGWSITEEGNLALGEKDVFYQCLSGSFYNLYDESIGVQCTPIHLGIVDLVSC